MFARAVFLRVFFLALLVGGCASTSTPSVDGGASGALSELTYESFLLRLSSSKDEKAAKEFLEGACRQSFQAACDALGKRANFVGERLPILQGGTNDSSTELIVVSAPSEPVYLLVWGDSLRHPLQSNQAARIAIPADLREVVHFEVDGLKPDQDYRAQFLRRDGRLVDSRIFRSLNVGKRKARIAVASCMDDAFVEVQKVQWNAMLDEKPDAIFLIGDNIYTDLTDGKGTGPSNTQTLWRRYLETRSRLALFFAKRLVPTFALWDDHDYGVNDGDKDYPNKDVSRDVFQTFFGNPSYPGHLERGPGVSFRLDAFGQIFFFLDGRYHRSAPEKTIGTEATHFGRDVEGWLFAGLDGRTPTWLVAGDQFFGGYHQFESYEGVFPTSFRKFIARLKARGTPVAFISGDRHMTEVMRIERDVLGYETFELTTSPMHAKTYPGTIAKAPNPRQIAGKDGEVNFMILDLDTEGKWATTVKALGEGGRTLYRLSIHPADPATRPR